MTNQLKSNTQIISYSFLDQCKKITKDYEKLKGRWSSEAQVLHIIKEVCEFDIALRKGTPDEVMDEYADIGLTWLACGNFFAFSNDNINKCLSTKLEIVKQRVEKETSNKMGKVKDGQ